MAYERENATTSLRDFAKAVGNAKLVKFAEAMNDPTLINKEHLGDGAFVQVIPTSLRIEGAEDTLYLTQDTADNNKFTFYLDRAQATALREYLARWLAWFDA